MWSQVVSVVAGVWLMLSPGLFSISQAAAAHDRLAGFFAAAAALVALCEVTRSVRWANFVLGTWLLLMPFFYRLPSGPALNHLVIGLCLMVFASRKGKIIKRCGGGWRALWK